MAWENSRPIAAPIWAVSLIGERRSSRAVERIVQGRWDRKRAQRGGKYIRLILFTQQSGFQDALGEFFHEERDAVGLGHDLVEDVRRQLLSGRHAVNHRHCLVPVEPVERQRVALSRPIQGAANSGRNVITNRIGKRRICSISRLVRSSEVGSSQCTSSATISNGAFFAALAIVGEHRGDGPFFQLGRFEVRRGITLLGRDRQQ